VCKDYEPLQDEHKHKWISSLAPSSTLGPCIGSSSTSLTSRQPNIFVLEEDIQQSYNLEQYSELENISLPAIILGKNFEVLAYNKPFSLVYGLLYRRFKGKLLDALPVKFKEFCIQAFKIVFSAPVSSTMHCLPIIMSDTSTVKVTSCYSKEHVLCSIEKIEYFSDQCIINEIILNETFRAEPTQIPILDVPKNFLKALAIMTSLISTKTSISHAPTSNVIVPPGTTLQQINSSVTGTISSPDRISYNTLRLPPVKLSPEEFQFVMRRLHLSDQ
jgi:hypothetical protein